MLTDNLSQAQAAAWDMFSKMQAAGNEPQACVVMAVAAATAHIRRDKRQRIRDLAVAVEATCPDRRDSRLLFRPRRSFADMLGGS